MRPSPVHVLTGLALLIVLALPRAVSAYPHYQLATGSERCAQCHIAPGGGGLLTSWGREESADTISGGGNGNFLHGAVTLPESLILGGDIRVAGIANDVGASDGTELAAFPMQLDLAAAVVKGAWTVTAVIGARGRVRDGDPDAPMTPPDSMTPIDQVDRVSLASYLISRQHYVMYRPDEASGIYVRAGRFAAPYGLRLADHTTYVRRYLGYNLLEETYGASVGYLGSAFELHATAFVYDPLQGAPRDEKGGALLVETQRGTVVLGASARASVATTSTRLQTGVHGKLWLAEKVLVQGELHGVRELFDGPGDRTQLAAYTGPVWIARKGIHLGLAYQAFAHDLAVRGVLRQGLDAWLSYLPIAHVEIMVQGRAQRVGPREDAYLAMLQLHYYL